MANDHEERRPTATNPVLSSPNKLKLGVFGINCSNGTTMSNQPGSLKAEWQESLAIAKAAEAAGIEAAVPIGRWKGMGGDVNFQHRNFETLTWAAGIAAATDRIGVFATVHTPTIHPVRLAKTCATIDHISNGRFALNVVAGWNEKEIGMFEPALLPHDERYAVADEWLEFTKALWNQAGEVDWNGKYYKSPGAYSEPKPIQSPAPVLMSAGNSGSGMAFAAKHCDLNFVAAPSIEKAGKSAADVKALARKDYDRDISVFSQAYIICRESEDEAQALFHRITHEEGDHVGARNLLDLFVPNSSSADWEKMTPAIIAGWGSYPLVGTPRQIAEGLIAFSQAGLDGMVISWTDYLEGIDQFDKQIMPYLVEAGVRTR